MPRTFQEALPEYCQSIPKSIFNSFPQGFSLTYSPQILYLEIPLNQFHLLTVSPWSVPAVVLADIATYSFLEYGYNFARMLRGASQDIGQELSKGFARRCQETLPDTSRNFPKIFEKDIPRSFYRILPRQSQKLFQYIAMMLPGCSWKTFQDIVRICPEDFPRISLGYSKKLCQSIARVFPRVLPVTLD